MTTTAPTRTRKRSKQLDEWLQALYIYWSLLADTPCARSCFSMSSSVRPSSDMDSSSSVNEYIFSASTYSCSVTFSTTSGTIRSCTRLTKPRVTCMFVCTTLTTMQASKQASNHSISRSVDRSGITNNQQMPADASQGTLSPINSDRCY
jgi:hypothetical protein